MFDLASLLISPALADAGAALPPPADNMSALTRFMPLFLIFAVFYFLLIRPQQVQMKKQNDMMAALKKGDKIVTAGGIIGTITKIEDGDDLITVEIASGVSVHVLRSTITGLAPEKTATLQK